EGAIIEQKIAREARQLPEDEEEQPKTQVRNEDLLSGGLPLHQWAQWYSLLNLIGYIKLFF
ncbi:MAG: hypothetical protein ACKVOH_05050, partial [Chlamydiales bacterium]